ncbi:uncharacterized protein LOC105191950 isoform X1 [Harpegnathos saltator]|uniref:uncharacterized protein LOC105191950 isoform X1 n=1 Tax=Harpegnathos saltator TaxID=610380 RepID=UPI00058B33B5|nr:uncharacterized protein LOC105191950 isoform X1 [Harpegnathos saltator]XP_025156878.1 uncharacterized protein LOC105191950 isoform X1 [Harpegnathos saltator]XP_025156879.1 uncharacterized protein LOC105191950 isoform X1 [Harpegnathos saltator]
MKDNNDHIKTCELDTDICEQMESEINTEAYIQMECDREKSNEENDMIKATEYTIIPDVTDKNDENEPTNMMKDKNNHTETCELDTENCEQLESEIYTKICRQMESDREKSNEGIYNYYWNDNVFEIYEDDNIYERTSTERIATVNTITEHSDDSHMSTGECITSNNSVQDNLEKDTSYILSNTSSDRSLAEPTINKESNSIVEKTNNSTNTSGGLDVSMFINVSGKGARDDTEMFVLPLDAGKRKHFYVLQYIPM